MASLFSKIRLRSLLKHLVLGSAVASKAAASTIVPTPNLAARDVWANVRQEYQDRAASTALPAEIADTLSVALAEDDDVIRTIHLSYLAVPAHLHEALDRYWLAQPRVQQSAEAFEMLMQTRRQLSSDHAVFNPDELTSQWLHRAHHKPGHYDQGGGND